jgi:ribonuclease HI
MKKVTIYTDGSSFGKSNDCGGWGCALIHEKTLLKLSGYDSNATNQTMELMAALQGLLILKESCEVLIILDSQYVMHGFTKFWVKNWKKNNWINSSGDPVKNKDLWMRLDEEVSKHKVTWMWVKGHSGDFYNEMVDKLAKAAKISKMGVKEYSKILDI